MFRTLIAGVLGGVAMFGWGAAYHMLCPLWEEAVRPLPDDKSFASNFKSEIKEPGFYFFPAIDMAAVKKLPPEERKKAESEWEAKMVSGPRGIVVYSPTGEAPMSPKQLGLQFLTCLVCGVLAAQLLAMAGGPTKMLMTRVVFVTLIGVTVAFAAAVPEWIWYGFPGNFTVAAMGDSIGEFLVGGLVIGFMMKPKKV